MASDDRELLLALAANVRRLRGERKLSLNRLAQRSGVAKATVSKIEAGTANPTLDTLEALSSTLSVGIADLLEQRGPAAVEVVRSGQGTDTDSLMRGWIVKTMIVGSTLVEVYDLEVQPGGDEVSASHGPGAREHVLVQSGTLRAGPIDALVELAAGDYATYPADGPHRWAAVGDVPTRFWVVHTSPTTPR